MAETEATAYDELQCFLLLYLLATPAERQLILQLVRRALRQAA